jgi:hypothetical protein
MDDRGRARGAVPPDGSPRMLPTGGAVRAMHGQRQDKAPPLVQQPAWTSRQRAMRMQPESSAGDRGRPGTYALAAVASNLNDAEAPVFRIPHEDRALRGHAAAGFAIDVVVLHPAIAHAVIIHRAPRQDGEARIVLGKVGGDSYCTRGEAKADLNPHDLHLRNRLQFQKLVTSNDERSDSGNPVPLRSPCALSESNREPTD